MLPTLDVAAPVATVDGKIVSEAVSDGWLTVTNIGSGQHSISLSSRTTQL
jgi:hypothetical protein